MYKVNDKFKNTEDGDEYTICLNSNAVNNRALCLLRSSEGAHAKIGSTVVKDINNITIAEFIEMCGGQSVFIPVPQDTRQDTPQKYKSIRIHPESYDKLAIWAKKGHRTVVNQVDVVVEKFEESQPEDKA